jgi:ABC-type transport system involved in multi-copper enzyme maturation permease subunit
LPEKAVISHRGEKYEIGRGKRFYGIWVVGAPYEAPVDRWPENLDGWQQAWSRFASMEEPGTIEPAARDRKSVTGRLRLTGRPRLRRPGGGSLLVGEGLLVLGVVLGLAGLFPAYAGGQSLLSQSDQVVPHLLYVIGWGLTAALVALSVARPSNAARYGALFGLGISAVTFGLFLADLGEVAFGGASLGTGLVVSLLGWLACTAGSALALAAGTPQQGQPSRPVRPGRGHAGPLTLLVLASIGTAATFAPSWDSYTLVAAANGTTQSVTAGNAFDNPGMVIAGNVAVMVAVVVVAVVAALWRPPRQGALLLAGAVVPLVAEAVSALLQSGTAPTPAMFGISSADATALGLSISSGVTAIFWVFFVFVISLAVLCAWLFTEPGHQVMPVFPGSPWGPAGGDQGMAAPAGAVVSEDTDSEAAETGADADARARTEAAADADSEDPDTASGRDSGAQADGGGQSAYA